MNLLDARLESDGSASLADGLGIPLPESARSALATYRDRPVILGIRPEDLRPQPGRVALPLRVVAIEALGPEVILIASLQDGREIAARMSRNFTAPIGSAHQLWLDPAAIHLFDPATTRAIAREAKPHL
jgi:ABC-type sugar transport system ATPase subunit